MTWGARVGRAAVLSALGVGWAVAGHVWGGPAPHPGPSGPGLVLAPALWSLLAVLLLTSYLPDADRTSSVRGAPGARLQAGAWVGAALGGGQLLTHVALSVAPLLQGQVRQAAGAAAHHGHASTNPLSGGPDAGALLTASLHGGAGMAGAHLLATVAAAAAWVAVGALWSAVLRWWRRVVVRRPRMRPAHRARAGMLPALPRLMNPSSAWDGRGPPVPA